MKNTDSRLRFVSPRMHAPVDYVIVVLFALAPMIFGFGGVAATLSYVVAVAYLGLSLTTAYPLGLVKLVPFTIHGWIELALAPLFVAAPWIFGFDEVREARWFFVAMGVAAFAVWATTDYRAAEVDPRQRRVMPRARRGEDAGSAHA
jgi:hypothetical protein